MLVLKKYSETPSLIGNIVNDLETAKQPWRREIRFFCAHSTLIGITTAYNSVLLGLKTLPLAMKLALAKVPIDAVKVLTQRFPASLSKEVEAHAANIKQSLALLSLLKTPSKNRAKQFRHAVAKVAPSMLPAPTKLELSLTAEKTFRSIAEGCILSTMCLGVGAAVLKGIGLSKNLAYNRGFSDGFRSPTSVLSICALAILTSVGAAAYFANEYHAANKQNDRLRGVAQGLANELAEERNLRINLGRELIQTQQQQHDKPLDISETPIALSADQQEKAASLCLALGLSCVIGQAPLNNPVTLGTGKTYSKDMITEWLLRSNICPASTKQLTDQERRLVPNLIIASLVSEIYLLLAKGYKGEQIYRRLNRVDIPEPVLVLSPLNEDYQAGVTITLEKALEINPEAVNNGMVVPNYALREYCDELAEHDHKLEARKEKENTMPNRERVRKHRIKALDKVPTSNGA
ncbi:MAG: hypothetical protein Q8K75_02880 [Chlamydiales bacterium]|nr:hypothetical protein [Chlamydiales bacterium]